MIPLSGIAPFFIVKNVPAALSFYRDRLGFDICAVDCMNLAKFVQST